MDEDELDKLARILKQTDWKDLAYDTPKTLRGKELDAHLLANNWTREEIVKDFEKQRTLGNRNRPYGGRFTPDQILLAIRCRYIVTENEIHPDHDD